jgi:hypothetical protein
MINYIQVDIDYWGLVKSGHPTKYFPDVKFQEDMQVIYDDGWTGAKAVYSGHRGSADHKSRRTEIGPLDNSYADNRGQI